MIKGYLRISVWTATLLAPLVVAGADLQVTLSPQGQSIKYGETPQFVVRVQARVTPQQVLKFSERHDLRDNYAELIVTVDGKRVEVPRLISDPGSTSVSDYLRLDPGEIVTFEHNGMPFMLSKLHPATYSAVIRLRADWRSDAVMSNSVSFTVLGR